MRIPMSFAAAVNMACASLPVDPAQRQELLEQSDLVERHRRALEELRRALTRVLKAKEESPDAPDRSHDLN